MTDNKKLIEQWQAAWPEALAVWSKFTRLSNPQLCQSSVAAAKEGLTGSFAMIRLVDKSVVIDLEGATQLKLHDYALEILAHEIGHHVLAPSNATDHYRLLARIRAALPTLEKHAPMVANLYTDLLINDRLQRRANLRMADIYQRLQDGNEKKPSPGVWTLYMRIYEHLWQLEKGALGGGVDDSKFDNDAWLGARVIRVYANQWLDGAGRFATLLLPYLVDEKELNEALKKIHDTQEAAVDCEPSGLTDIDPAEAAGAVHPVDDPLITGSDEESEDEKSGDTRLPGKAQPLNNGAGQRREPFQYGEILKASGIKLSDHDIAIRYYQDAALPYLIPFPSRPSLESREPLIEGLDPWDIGDPLDDIDWVESISRSPTVFPGLTTVQRQYGFSEGDNPARVPIDLDMYIDSSGSMPNPQQRISYIALAGAIIALSALRSGSRVQATLWASKNQVMSTNGFVRDQREILKVLTGFFGGGTTFPIHKLRETFHARKATDRECHILQLSDDGIDTMFETDEHGNSGWDISAMALNKARAGGTMALNISHEWKTFDSRSYVKTLRRAEAEQGWKISAIADMKNLVEFAQAFSRHHYSNTPAAESVT